MILPVNQEFSLKDITIKDPYLQNAYAKDVQYLCSFDTDRLLAGFRETAGISMRGAVRYPGWESMLIGGHTLGHYMTACVKACESANCGTEEREALAAVLRELTEGLHECQEALGSGFLFGALLMDKSNPEQQFDMVEKNMTNIITQAWVPWYTMHKIIEGLVSACHMEDVCEAAASIRATALKVLGKLGDWVYSRTSSWDEQTHRTVLGIEYGGMNDCMYDVYLLTGEKRHLKAAEAFDETELFEKVLSAKPGDHVLNNHHANTTIPKFMGALKRYVVTGEEQYYRYAVKFRDLVTNHHTYVTGGNSEWEHFGEDDVLDAERTNCNCETCNSYNMLKMTKLLFMITGEHKYADWYEKAFINSVLSSQNPQSGMTMYFQPMAGGYHKVYGEPFSKFWCCTGTGMENFSKLQESFCFSREDCLVINQYFSFEAVYRGVNFTMEADLLHDETVKLTIGSDYTGDISLRLPGWLASEAEIRIDDIVHCCIKQDGYALLKGPFAAGCRVEMQLPMRVEAHALPDGRDTYAFTYGPFVLSALLGTKDIREGVTGVDVTVSQNRLFEKTYLPAGTDRITVEQGDVKTYIAQIHEKLVRSEEMEGFVLQGTDASLTFVPHFSQHAERYGIYFRFTDAAGEEEDKGTGFRVIDTVQPGYGQYENDEFHAMKEAGAGSVGKTHGGTLRYAKAGGSFGYRMEVEAQETALRFFLRSGDAGKKAEILVDGVLLETVCVNACEDEFQMITIPLPPQVLAKSERIFRNCRERRVCEVTFRAPDTEDSAAICNFLYTIV